jgi:hypothetical protein
MINEIWGLLLIIIGLLMLLDGSGLPPVTASSGKYQSIFIIAGFLIIGIGLLIYKGEI